MNKAYLPPCHLCVLSLLIRICQTVSKEPEERREQWGGATEEKGKGEMGRGTRDKREYGKIGYFVEFICTCYNSLEGSGLCFLVKDVHHINHPGHPNRCDIILNGGWVAIQLVGWLPSTQKTDVGSTHITRIYWVWWHMPIIQEVFTAHLSPTSCYILSVSQARTWLFPTRNWCFLIRSHWLRKRLCGFDVGLTQSSLSRPQAKWLNASESVFCKVEILINLPGGLK